MKLKIRKLLKELRGLKEEEEYYFMNKVLKKNLTNRNDVVKEICRYLIFLVFLFFMIDVFLPILNQLLFLSKETYDFSDYYTAQFVLFFSLGFILGFLDFFCPGVY